MGRLDHVVANAGFSLPGNLENHEPEAMRSMVLTNVLGPALLVRETLPHLRESKGRIVLVGSVAGVRNTPATCTPSPSGPCTPWPRTPGCWSPRTG